MEDCKINYDYTVRNAAGSIVQFLYGEDGIDPVKIESQMLPYIELDYTKLCNEYLWTEDDDTTYYLIDKPKQDTFKRLKAHFDQLLVDREFMIQRIFNNKKETSIFYPISFFRIITIAKSMFQKNIKPVLSDLDPEYVMDMIEELCETLYLNKANKGNKFLNILLRIYLTPKKVCFEYRFDKLTFDYVVKTIKMRFYDSIANPSEMVGVVAAQSIGEPCTQLSQSAHTKILIYKKNGDKITPYYTTMGEFIDNMLNANKKSVIDLGNDSVVYDPKADYYIVGVSDNEKTSWRRILQVSKHPANGDLMKVYTRSGKTTTATLSHSFLKRTEKSIVPVEGYDLKVGDRIPVAKYIPVVENAQTSIKIGDQEFNLDNELGWLCGVYIADGNITGNKVSISKVIPEYIEMLREIVKEKLGLDISTYYKTGKIDADKNGKWMKEYESQSHTFNHKDMAEFLATNFGNGSYNKYIPGWVYTANLDFIRGLIGGYFDGDGNVADGKGKGMVRAHSVSEKFIENMIVLLCYIGVFASKCLEAKKEKHLGDLHTIQISRKYAEIFKNEVGFVVESKKNALEKVIEYINDETRKDNKEYIDKIPELGEAIAYIGRKLNLPGQSRNYGRWAKKDSIGRNTLIGYIKIFEDANEEKKFADVTAKIAILKQAAYSDVVWDEIVDIEYIEDPKEYVYDFTVPGNDSFMVDCGVLVHNTLNTFHSSGISSASKTVRGVPRIKELLSVTKNIKSPSLTIYIKDEAKTNKKACTDILNSIQTTYFKDVVSSSKIYFDPDDFNTTIDDDKLFLATYKEFMNQGLYQASNLSPWLLRLEFSRDKLHENNITMMDIHYVLHEFYEDTISAMFSDDNSNNLVCRIKLVESEKTDESDMITELKALEKSILENIVIKGIKNINKVMMNKKDDMTYNSLTMQFESSYEWVLDTNGTNLLDILCNSKIDKTRTISNDINEIYETLGIEAARHVLFSELSETLAGLYVNYRHLSLLVDTMTNKGYLLSIDRHGINRIDIGPLAKCSFEESVDMVIKAGMFSEIDKINGVSANIMLGQIPPAGTGDTDILIDEQRLLELEGEEEEDYELEMDTNQTSYAFDDEAKENICSNLNIEFEMPDADKSFVEQKMDLSIKIV